jgi:alpha-1,4-digalacturonate transport system substrate-binding protein
VTQAIVGEMGTDEAVTKITADMQDAIKQAQK